MSEERGNLYLLTGLVFGLILGVFFAWVISPVKYADTNPASLRGDFRDAYRSMIASAYAGNRDLMRAQARLALLEDADITNVLAAQAQRSLAENHPYAEAQALALLASALRQAATFQATINIPTDTPIPSDTLSPAPANTTSPTASPTSTPSSTHSPTLTATETDLPQSTITPSPEEGNNPTETHQPAQTVTASRTTLPTSSPTSTNTPLPTLSPTPTLGPPFVLDERNFVCDPNLIKPLVQVVVMDAAEQGVPGVRIVINWDDFEERFYTGLKPELGSGYADYTITPGVNYSLRVGEGGQLISGLAAAECETDGGESYWGSWLLSFSQP